RLLRVEEVRVYRLEESRVQRDRLREHLPVRQPAGADHLDTGQRRGGIEDPQRGVVEISARDEPFVRLVYHRQRAGCGAQQLQLRVTFADLVQPREKRRDRLVVGVQETALRQQRVHERVVHRALDALAELR